MMRFDTTKRGGSGGPALPDAAKRQAARLMRAPAVAGRAGPPDPPRKVVAQVPSAFPHPVVIRGVAPIFVVNSKETL